MHVAATFYSCEPSCPLGCLWADNEESCFELNLIDFGWFDSCYEPLRSISSSGGISSWVIILNVLRSIFPLISFFLASIISGDVSCESEGLMISFTNVLASEGENYSVGRTSDYVSFQEIIGDIFWREYFLAWKKLKRTILLISSSVIWTCFVQFQLIDCLHFSSTQQ